LRYCEFEPQFDKAGSLKHAKQEKDTFSITGFSQPGTVEMPSTNKLNIYPDATI
jgi:hypothetical protein